MKASLSNSCILWLATALLSALEVAEAFSPATNAPSSAFLLLRPLSSSPPARTTVLSAGGFEWEDPAEAFDQGVENPFKNPELTNSEEGLKIDPARLLSPRLNGANLYFVGMMGSGKSAVSQLVAKRKQE